MTSTQINVTDEARRLGQAMRRVEERTTWAGYKLAQEDIVSRADKRPGTIYLSDLGMREAATLMTQLADDLEERGLTLACRATVQELMA